MHPLQAEGALANFFEWLLHRGHEKSMVTYRRSLHRLLPGEHKAWLECSAIQSTMERAAMIYGEDRVAAENLKPALARDAQTRLKRRGGIVASLLCLALGLRFVLGLRPGESGESREGGGWGRRTAEGMARQEGGT